MKDKEKWVRQSKIESRQSNKYKEILRNNNMNKKEKRLHLSSRLLSVAAHSNNDMYIHKYNHLHHFVVWYFDAFFRRFLVVRKHFT